jgi:hypothetical protein
MKMRMIRIFRDQIVKGLFAKLISHLTLIVTRISEDLWSKKEMGRSRFDARSITLEHPCIQQHQLSIIH